MNTTYLREFLRVIDKNSFQAAAASLGISASTLTRHIQALEEETGELLLARDTHSLALTEAGSVFIRYARSIVESQNELFRDLSNIKEGSVRNLSIGIPLNHDETAFEEFILAFHKEHPEINVDFSAFPARKLFQRLQQEDEDLIFSHEFDSQEASLEYVPFTRDELFIHITEANPLYNAKIIDYSMLDNQLVYMRYNPQSSFTRYINKTFEELGIHTALLNLEGFWPQNNSSALFMTTGSKISSIHHSGNVRILPLTPPITFTYGIFYQRSKNLSDEVRIFLDFCRKWSISKDLLKTGHLS